MQERIVDANKCGNAKSNKMTTVRIDKLVTDDNIKLTDEFSLSGIFINYFSHIKGKVCKWS